jgi:hypothetical protein
LPRGGFNSERCALLGSAYKRLAGVIATWSRETDRPEFPTGKKQALEQSARWYQRVEGEPHQPDFKPYNVQNRLALQAVLGTAKPEDADLARLAGRTARRRFESSRKPWDLIMVGDGELIARIIDQSLTKPPASGREPDAARIVIDCYTQLVEQLPQSRRQFDSVLKQIDLLKTFAQERAQAEASHRPALNRLAENLDRIARALKPPVSPGSNPSAAGSSAGETRDRVSPKKSAKGRAKKTAPKRKPPKGGKRPPP